MRYLDKFRKMIWTIDEKDFEGLLKEGFFFSLTYFLILLSIGSFASFVSFYIASKDAVIAAIATFFSIIVYAAGIGLVLPLISHFLLGLFGAKRPLSDTFQIYFYASTPSLVLSWVPCLGSFSPMVSFGNVFRGLREINKLGFWQAAIAVLLPSLGYWGLWIYLGILLKVMK